MKAFLNSFPGGIPYAQFLQGRAVGHSAVIINLVVVLFIAWSLARLTWSLWPMPQNETLSVAPSLNISAANTPTGTATRLADLHLFGEAKEQEPEPETALAAPETQLKLTLSGVLSTADKLTARAIIAGPDGQDKPYAVGDTLPGNATLHQILVDRVILKSGGRFETLRLPEDSNGSAQTQGVMMGAVNSPGALAMPGNAGVNLQQYRQQILNNPARLFDLVQVVPISENGVFRGFRLGPGRDPRMLQRFGLQPGDTVTQINGIALDDPSKGAQALQSIATASSINLTVQRGGQEQQVTVAIDGLVDEQ
jgi:general secretion pathway protein C